MKVTFVRNSLRTQETPQTESPVCVVGFVRCDSQQGDSRQGIGQQGDPQQSLPEGLRDDVIRTMRPPPPRIRREGQEEAASSGYLRIDTLVMTSQLNVYALPGLDAQPPSRLRDSVQLLLEALPTVTILLVTSPLEAPLEDDDVLAQLRLALGELPGGILIVPDLDPPDPMARSTRGASVKRVLEQLRTRFERWEARVLRLGPLCRELFMTGLFDAPNLSAETLYTWCLSADAEASSRPGLTGPLAVTSARVPGSVGDAFRTGVTGLSAGRGQQQVDDVASPSRPRSFRQQHLEQVWAGLLEDATARLTGLDLALCVWVGPWEPLRIHGWRSAAAVAARTLAAQPGSAAVAQLERRRVVLEGGRQHVPSLEPVLFRRFPAPLQLAPAVARLLVPVRLEDRVEARDGGNVEARAHACRFDGQLCLRAPAGFWPIPAVRSLKQIELHLRRIAERFVFRAASEMQALELANALRFALDDYLRNGVLTPLPSAPGMVRARADVSGEPGLIAEIEASLRPWTYTIRIKLHVRPGSILLEAA